MQSRARESILTLTWLCGTLACATPNAQPQTAPPPTPAPLTAAAVYGVWVEYWAPTGVVDTERYRFLEDGQFVWDAPRTAASRTAIHKTGQFQLQARGPHETAALMLNVGAEEFAPCATCATGSDASGAQHVDHAVPIVEQYELGECAPNLEAQALDAHYACLAIGGRAFWRQQPMAAGAEAQAQPSH